MKEILIFTNGEKIGDGIIKLPFIQEIFRHFQNTKITWLAYGTTVYSTSLKEILGLDPGSVSPYGLINDNNKVTKFYLDKDILSENTVNFHPLTNNFTINLTVNNFVNFINKINVKLHLINLEVYRLINNGKY